MPTHRCNTPNTTSTQTNTPEHSKPDPECPSPSAMLWSLPHTTPPNENLQASSTQRSSPQGTPANLLQGPPLQTNYAARTNLAPLTPTNEEGPAASTTSVSTRARSWEDLHPPPPTTLPRRPEPRTCWTPVKDSKVRPPIPTQRTSPLQTKENPYTPGWKFRESNSIQHPKMPQNSTRELPPPPLDLGSPPCDAPPHPNKPWD
ncbi:hypothetical protein E4T56_gene4512 [Termitomyces sp. T112]|nr:hypothetical protein E4T56_gene4512 [Termitomyces sp. T112]